MVNHEKRSYLPTEVSQMLKLPEAVHRMVESSGITAGLVAVMRAPTTCGIIVNEGLPCVERDLQDMLEGMVPLDAPYAHAHFLPSYGATGNNSQGHLKQTLTGNSCMFPVQGGKVVCGGAQDVYLAEFDGPQRRSVYFEVIGE